MTIYANREQLRQMKMTAHRGMTHMGSRCGENMRNRNDESYETHGATRKAHTSSISFEIGVGVRHRKKTVLINLCLCVF